MKGFLNLNSKRENKGKDETKYELISLISCKEQQLARSEYFTLIRKEPKRKDYHQWFAYQGNAEVAINEKIALNDFPP